MAHNEHRSTSSTKQFGVKYLVQEHIDMWTGGAGNQKANLPIIGRPLYLLSHSQPK